ncbi:MAG: VanZ family protein [Bacilli bacterium]|nr:VanZ family protein [Bacilli bacterium]
MKVDTLVDALSGIWPMLTIFLVVIVTIRVVYLLQNHEKIVFYKEFMMLVSVIYVLLLYQLLTSTELNNTSGGLNLVPFTEIMRYKFGSPLFYTNVIGNILIFVPLGFFISKYIKPQKITPIFIVSLVISVTVELVQLNIGRSFDIDDIILNIIGAILGFLVYISLNAINKHLPKVLQSDLFYNIICIIIIIVAFLYFANNWKGLMI